MRFFHFWLVFVSFSLIALPSQAAQWSDTTPPLNLSHIFDGDINKRGKAVGFHVRNQGRDPQNARLTQRLSGPNSRGIYTGRTAIYNPKSGAWVPKKFSTFFPDHLSRPRIIELILESFHNSRPDQRGKWRGENSDGFVIEGWLCPKKGSPRCPAGSVNTAYPIYQKD